MLNLDWEFSVLSRAVAYGNLSAAAIHVGLSQPQISRIVARIEERLGVVLLDRAARRKSGWTPIAYRLAEAYTGMSRKFESEIQTLVKASEPTHLKIATLEGLLPLAIELSRRLLSETGVSVLELDVHDLNLLEEKFLAGHLDCVFTAREPGKKKYRFSKLQGYQSLARESVDPGLRVRSSFEFQARESAGEKGKTATRILVSNSLEVRRKFIREIGGEGTLPSEVKKTRPSSFGTSVLLLATDQFSPTLWEKIAGWKLSR